MESFQKGLAVMDRDGVARFLWSREEPCTESALLRIAFPDIQITGTAPLALFQHHFLLFHHLYRLQDRFRIAGFYLHIHFMRTGRFLLPPAGKCRFFEEERLAFCGRGAVPGEWTYCGNHLAPLSNGALESLSLRHFYLDPENFTALDRETAEAFLNGPWELLIRFDRYQESLDALGIAGTPDLDQVRTRFRALAMAHHPDRTGASAERFHAVNRAYRFLLRVIPQMSASKNSADQ
ncbi:MAG: DNA-J related domain-containing protein [Thermodesulfobacteriota bacterium]